jgi:hypothetical protein
MGCSAVIEAPAALLAVLRVVGVAGLIAFRVWARSAATVEDLLDVVGVIA